MERLRGDAAIIEASSRDGLRNSERKTNGDAYEKRMTRTVPLGTTNADEGSENTTGGNATRHKECDLQPHANRAHTTTQDSCRLHLQNGDPLGRVYFIIRPT